MNVKISTNQLLKFLKNKRNNIYLLSGWLNEVPALDFINHGKNGMTFGVKIKDNGDVEIYNFRISNKLTKALQANQYVIAID